MHMADALLTPAVGGSMWAATAAVTAYSSRKVRQGMDDFRVPLMGVLGAFIFAAQMINFTIPGTGSSGHLAGGMILAILLGPCAGFLTVASVLTVQALFFADGGLLALGANIFNIGFFSCFAAYALIYRPIAGRAPTSSRTTTACIAASIVALQLGSAGVVVETVASGISELPFRSFFLLMQPVHLVIGVVEGVVTAAVVAFVWRAQPEVLETAGVSGPVRPPRMKILLSVLLSAALVIGGGLSWFASQNPDGLEWSIEKLTANKGLKGAESSLHEEAKKAQDKTALFPGYKTENKISGAGDGDEPGRMSEAPSGKGTAGLVGGLLTFLAAVAVGHIIRKRPGRPA